MTLAIDLVSGTGSPVESGCSPASLGGSSPRNVTRRWSTSDWPEALVRTLLDATASLQSKIVEEMLRKDGSFEKEFQKIVDLGQASIEKRERELGRDKRDEERKRSKLKDEMEQMETLKKAWDDLQSFADAKNARKAEAVDRRSWELSFATTSHRRPGWAWFLVQLSGRMSVSKPVATLVTSKLSSQRIQPWPSRSPSISPSIVT